MLVLRTRVTRFASPLCDPGRKIRDRKLKLPKARAMVPALERELQRMAGRYGFELSC